MQILHCKLGIQEVQRVKLVSGACGSEAAPECKCRDLERVRSLANFVYRLQPCFGLKRDDEMQMMMMHKAPR